MRPNPSYENALLFKEVKDETHMVVKLLSGFLFTPHLEAIQAFRKLMTDFSFSIVRSWLDFANHQRLVRSHDQIEGLERSLQEYAENDFQGDWIYQSFAIVPKHQLSDFLIEIKKSGMIGLPVPAQIAISVMGLLPPYTSIKPTYQTA